MIHPEPLKHLVVKLARKTGRMADTFPVVVE